MSDQPLIIGIDSSTTACKGIAWTPEGVPVAESRASYVMRSPQPNYYEQTADDWWQAVCTVLRGVASQIDMARVKAVCITNQRESIVPVDENGKAIREAILWLDDRSRAQVAYLDAQIGNDKIHALTGKGPSTTQSLPKLVWLQQHEPDILKRAYKIVEPHAYLVYHLTGEWVTSLPCADPLGTVDMAAGEWSRSLLEQLGLPTSHNVPIVLPGTIIGQVTQRAAEATGLLAGTPVVAGSGDGQAAGLGANITSADRAYLNLGTAMVSGVHSDTYVHDRSFRTMCSPIPHAYVLEEALTGGTFTVSWFVDTFGADLKANDLDMSVEQQFEALAKNLPAGAGGLMSVPYWGGVMSPYWDALASGIMIGWTGAHRREHFYRSILEGIAYEHRLAMDNIARATGQPIETYILMGGGSRSDLWCQIVADVLNKPVYRAGNAEASNLGAAILAAAGVGLHNDIRSAADAMTHVGRGFDPDPATSAIYEQLYSEVYVHLFPALQAHIDRLSEITTRISDQS